MPTPFPSRPRVGHSVHTESALVPGCPECEMVLSVLSVEADLRDLSVDLWVAGWTPGALLDHVSGEVADPRAVDLTARAILFEDTTRAEHARPSAWRSEIERLRGERDLGRVQLRSGWIIDWISDHARGDRVGDVAAVIEVTMHVLSELNRPAPGPVWADASR